MACGGHIGWQGDFREPWKSEPEGMQEFPKDISYSFALPQIYLGGGWW